MRSPAASCLLGKVITGILIPLLLGFPVISLSAQKPDPGIALKKTKSIAEMQHEIVMVLIKKKEYDEAAKEACKIFEMKWPEDQEPLLLKELLLLTRQFFQQDQPALGVYLIEKNSKCFKRTESRIAILKEKGYLHKKLLQNDKALDCFRKAQALEKAD
jgi:tetratricopeptide (TPR) repeat protein